MNSSIFQFFSFLGKKGALFIVSMIPVIELRGAIPLGYALDMGVWETFFISVIGNLVPVPFIILLIRPIIEKLKKTKKLSPYVHKFEQKMLNKADKVMKYSALGLFLFVAVPFPGTGAWSGAVIAALLNMRFKYALPAIAGGVVAAGIIMTAISFGVSSVIGFF